jgi:hypothetical protein
MQYVYRLPPTSSLGSKSEITVHEEYCRKEVAGG